MYLERAESDQARLVYDLIQAQAGSCGIPIETISLETFLESIFEPSFYFFWRDKDNVYALANIGSMEGQSRKAEFGVISFVRRAGHAADACFAVLRYGFETLGLHRMYAVINADNEASLSLCKKHRMVYEGRTRQSRFKAGRFIDQVTYGVLKTERHIWNPAGERRESLNASSGSRGRDGGGGRREGSQQKESSQEGGQTGQGEPQKESSVRVSGALPEAYGAVPGRV